MTNKLVLQQLKGVLRGLNDHDIEKLLSNYELVSSIKIDKTCRMVSYKCYEASMTYKVWTTNGYGRTEPEALNNCAKNFLELVMEDETSLANLIKAVKKGSESTLQAAQAKDNADKMNSTLALNASYAQGRDNTSFDNKNELDILSKNIGNISMIGNLKPTGEAAVNASQLEIDDILLKMMLDDGGNPTGGVNNFRKSLPPQHPNGLDLGSAGLAAAKNYSSGSYKPERNSVGGSGTGSTQNDDLSSQKKSVQENTNLNYGGSHHAHSSDKTEERYGSRNGRATQPNYYSSKTLNFSKTLDQKPLYQRQNSQDAYGESSQKEATKDVRTSIEKCSCNCYEQLQRANLRVESLEKKLKLLTEENKILKYLAESKDKELKSEFSVGNSVGPTKQSVYEKANGNLDAFNNENYDDINEFSEREPINPNDKSRSFSMDACGRKKTIPESQFNYKNPLTSYNKENAVNESMDKKDPKKIVPRLKLEMIPNYHAKFQSQNQNQTQAQNPLGVQNTNAVGATKSYVQQAIQNPSSSLYNQSNYESGIGASSSLSKYIKK